MATEAGDSRCSSCDPAAPRLLDQSAARYNDQAAFNAIAAQQNFMLQQQAAWMQLLKEQQSDSFNSTGLQMKFIDNLFGGE